MHINNKNVIKIFIFKSGKHFNSGKIYIRFTI